MVSLAAPIAAYLVRVVPAQLLGAIVGGMIILTNARTIMKSLDLTGGLRPLAYGLIIVAWSVAIVFAVRALRRTRREVASAPVAEPAPADLAGATMSQPVDEHATV